MRKKKGDNKKDFSQPHEWPQQKSAIKGALRTMFRRSPAMRYVLENAKVNIAPQITKSGVPSKKKRVKFRCNVCKNLFDRKFVQVDHIEPVVPLNKTEKDMTYDEIVSNIFCDIKNLQVICATPMKLNGGNPSCHKKKTDLEKFTRKYILDQANSGKPLADLIKEAEVQFSKKQNKRRKNE